jgi:hypothetical protein
MGRDRAIAVDLAHNWGSSRLTGLAWWEITPQKLQENLLFQVHRCVEQRDGNPLWELGVTGVLKVRDNYRLGSGVFFTKISPSIVCFVLFPVWRIKRLQTPQRHVLTWPKPILATYSFRRSSYMFTPLLTRGPLRKNDLYFTATCAL